jgi:hypothetical protein
MSVCLSISLFQVAQGYPSGDVIEIDDWLVDLIQMIKETAGLDPDK